MNGYLENLAAAVQDLGQRLAVVEQRLATPAPAPAAPAMSFAPAPVAAPAPAPMSFAPAPVAAPAPAPVPASVTADDITNLISPYIENQSIKDALGAEMRAMGINALPETQPAQYPELYQRFSGVIQRAAAAVAAPAPAPAAASII